MLQFALASNGVLKFNISYFGETLASLLCEVRPAAQTVYVAVHSLQSTVYSGTRQ